MKKMIVTLAALTALASNAWALGKGSQLLSVGLGQGSSDLATLSGDYLQPRQSPETNVGGEYWYLFSDDYAVAVAGAYGFYTQTQEPSTAAAPGTPDIESETTSFKLRVGGDRVGKVGERLIVFLGPGLEYWSGSGEVDNGTPPVTESATTTRYGISGRIGGIMMLNPGLGIMGQVGHTFGIASADDQGAKITWWPSSFEASWGLTFAFGGN
jgi:hypothetical protein